MLRWFMVAVALTGLVVMLGAAAASSAPKPQVISLFEMDTSDVFTGASNQLPKPGDAFISTGNYYKWAGAKRGRLIGHLQVECTFLVVTTNGGSAECSATAFLPGGALTAVGPLSFSAHTNRLPIVGGTGEYVGAQGYVATTNIGGENSNNSADVFHLTS